MTIFFLAFSCENKVLICCEKATSKWITTQTTNFGLFICSKAQNKLCLIQQGENQPHLSLLTVPPALCTSCCTEAIQLFYCFHVLNSSLAIVKGGSELFLCGVIVGKD